MTSTNDGSLAEALKELLNPSKLNHHIACVVRHDDSCQKDGPRTALLHVRFKEDEPQVEALAEFLWGQCMYYALPRRRRLKFKKALDEDFAVLAQVHQAVRDAFIDFNEKHPSRASELGEVLAYCVVQHHLSAPQVAAKMALKTSSNMPVHGLDGIHATFENGALTIYFLESKLSRSANDGVKDYATSAATFLSNRKQYLREYEIVSDLGHLDSLEGEAREAALDYFDILGQPRLPRRERFIGVICYSEGKHFANKIPVSDGPVDVHEKHFAGNYRAEHGHHQGAARKHIEDQGCDTAKSILFFVAVPDVNALREMFYQAMGVPHAPAEPEPVKEPETQL
ncbi:DUF1837 domain-containing protein (plasmid) [Microvirga sp. RSM25]|uniref:HamA C-terminal domain-containing protein n=1 Tax=Microvirga sp. RSM25 TaxID=3273802 RepID=UPI003850091F